MAWKKILLEGDAAVLSDTAPVDVDKSAAAQGSATEAGRQDHKHDVAVATPGDIAENHTAAEGTSASLARADHEHGTPANYTPSGHKTSHENDGGDEISVAGLSGELADAQPAKAHAADHKSGGGDVINLDEFGDPIGTIEINQQQLDGVVLESAATAPDAASEVDGQIYYNTADKHAYVFVSA